MSECWKAYKATPTHFPSSSISHSDTNDLEGVYFWVPWVHGWISGILINTYISLNTNFLLIVPYWYGNLFYYREFVKKKKNSHWRFFFIKSSEIYRISMLVCIMTNRWYVCLILLWRGQRNWKECHRPLSWLNQYTM